MDKDNQEQAADFEAWGRELRGPQIAGTRPAHVAYRRIVMHLDANGKPTYEDPIQVPVDKYGLPVRASGAEHTAEEQLELRWDAALIEHSPVEPYRPGKMPPWSLITYRTAHLLRADIRQDKARVERVRQWTAAGFTPELYVVLHELVPRVVSRLWHTAERRERTTWFVERLWTLAQIFHGEVR